MIEIKLEKGGKDSGDRILFLKTEDGKWAQLDYAMFFFIIKLFAENEERVYKRGEGKGYLKKYINKVFEGEESVGTILKESGIKKNVNKKAREIDRMLDELRENDWLGNYKLSISW